MGSFFSYLIWPFRTLRQSRNDFSEDHPDDLVYHLTLFFAFGIYTVIHRYQTARNKAIPFTHEPPEVRVFYLIILLVFNFTKAANPNWSNAQTIPNAHLESHKYEPGLLPMYEVPNREYITCFDPATGLHLGTLVADSATEIVDKIERAGHAQKAWRETSFADRRRVIRSLKKWLVENQEVCARVACRDTGKTRTWQVRVSSARVTK
jgi:hypothetical protein